MVDTSHRVVYKEFLSVLHRHYMHNPLKERLELFFWSPLPHSTALKAEADQDLAFCR